MSKRRTDRSIREQQVKSMSSPIPVPKRPDDTTSVLRRKSKKSRESPHGDSTISLPRGGSIRSSYTGMSDNHFEVGSMGLFNPRPTIRYSMQAQYVSGGLQPSIPPSRSSSKKEKTPLKTTPSRRSLKESRTIDDLVDDCDASTLRQLMERDDRRRTRKRKAEEAHARSRLDRHAARVERRANGRGLEEPEAGPSTLAPVNLIDARPGSAENPFQDPEPTSSSPFTDPLISRHGREARASMSSPISPIRQHQRQNSSLSQSTDPRNDSMQNLADSVAAEMKTSESRQRGPITNFFRRSGTGKRLSEDPGPPSETSFSNTSRESMKGQLPPAHLRESSSMPRTNSANQMRTVSKFREDLPESFGSIEPVVLASQSGDAETRPLTARQMEKQPEGSRVNSPLFENDEGLTRDSIGSIPPNSARELSQSLASVDSEGSWLTGKPRKRTSQQMTTPGTLNESFVTPTESQIFSTPNEGKLGNEYFQKRPSGHDPSKMTVGGIGSGLASGNSSEELATPGHPEVPSPDDTKIIRGQVARRPTVVHREKRVQSNEGLLRQFDDSNEQAEAVGMTQPRSSKASPEDLTTPAEDLPSPSEISIGEAQVTPVVKVHGGKHAHHVSSGSAKLLDIPARSNSRRESPKSDSGFPKD